MANPKKFNSPLIRQLAQALINGQSTPMEQAFNDPATLARASKATSPDIARNLFNNMSVKTNDGISGLVTPEGMSPDGISKVQEWMQPSLDKYTAMQDISDGVTGKQLGGLALGAVKEHPFKTAGLVGLGAGNIGGLMDNNKFGGQLGGLALGGIGSYLAGANPYTAAMMTMGGGELGALFDKLRAKREQQNQQPYYGGR